MSEPDTEHRGGCLCGRIRFVATGDPGWSGICHCASCRRATGGILMAAASFPRAKVRFEGTERRFYNSSPGMRRSFCGDCGSSLSYENARWPEAVNLTLATFDHPERLPPATQIFTAERLPWLHLADDRPRYPGEPVPGTEEGPAAAPRDRPA